MNKVELDYNYKNMKKFVDQFVSILRSNKIIKEQKRVINNIYYTIMKKYIFLYTINPNYLNLLTYEVGRFNDSCTI